MYIIQELIDDILKDYDNKDKIIKQYSKNKKTKFLNLLEEIRELNIEELKELKEELY